MLMLMLLPLTILISCVCSVGALRLLPFSYRSASSLSSSKLSKQVEFDALDAREVDSALKEIGPLIDIVQQQTELHEDIQTNQEVGEEIHRKYPFEEKGLPVLSDCNNFFSGTRGDFFWHQNADQVFVFIPVSDEIERKDIHAKFEAKQVTLSIQGKEIVSFRCGERIIPDGSFWLFEVDKEGKRYIQLDLEKRFRMINWKGLFSRSQPESTPQESQKRTEMLEKFFAANKGVANLSGIPSEKLNEMIANGDLTRMISDEVYSSPQVSTVSEDGTESETVAIPSEEEGNDYDFNSLINDTPILDGEMIDDNNN